MAGCCRSIEGGVSQEEQARREEERRRQQGEYEGTKSALEKKVRRARPGPLHRGGSLKH